MAPRLPAGTQMDGATRREFFRLANRFKLVEQTVRPSAVADHGVLFVEDNGAGKTRLMIQFGTGTPIQIAIEV